MDQHRVNLILLFFDVFADSSVEGFRDLVYSIWVITTLSCIDFLEAIHVKASLLDGNSIITCLHLFG